MVLVRNVFGLTDDNFLRKRGQLAVTMKTGRSDVVFSFFGERRTYHGLRKNTEGVMGPTVSWTYRAAPRTRTVIGGGWQRRNPTGPDNNEYTWNGSLALIRTISPKIDASLAYSYLKRNTPSVSDKYDENRVMFQINMQL